MTPASTSCLLVTPLSGPLAGYGRAGAGALSLVGGLRLDVRDAHPDPAAALRRGLEDRPDLVLGPYGSGPALAVSPACERPWWNHGGATSALRRPEHPHVLNVLAPAATYFDGTLQALVAADPGLATVTLVRSASGFATDVGDGAAGVAAALGLTVNEVVFVPERAEAVAAGVPDADVLLVAGRFDDEVTLAGALLAPGRWRAAAFVGAGTDEVLAGIPPAAREGLLGPAQWVPVASAPAPEEGPPLDWFLVTYRRWMGGEPPYPAAQALAAAVLGLRCLREAGGPDDPAVAAAALALDTTTLYGRFRLDPATGLQTGHEVLTVQWQDGARRVVWPLAWAEAEVRLGGAPGC